MNYKHIIQNVPSVKLMINSKIRRIVQGLPNLRDFHILNKNYIEYNFGTVSYGVLWT